MIKNFEQFKLNERAISHSSGCAVVVTHEGKIHNIFHFDNMRDAQEALVRIFDCMKKTFDADFKPIKSHNNEVNGYEYTNAAGSKWEYGSVVFYECEGEEEYYEYISDWEHRINRPLPR